MTGYLDGNGAPLLHSVWLVTEVVPSGLSDVDFHSLIQINNKIYTQYVLNQLRTVCMHSNLVNIIVQQYTCNVEEYLFILNKIFQRELKDLVKRFK